MPERTPQPTQRQPPQGKVGRVDVAAAALLFILSGTVLIIEILAARLLAPVVGLSLETYTSIIGVVLAGIACGHAIGGVVADRVPWERSLGPTIIVGGATAGLAVPVVEFFASRPGGGRVMATIVISFGAFFLPALSLSAATPIVTKARLRQLHSAGHVVGWLSAASTAGALVGAFLAGFVIVGYVPTSRALYALGGLTTALGLAIGSSGRMVRRAVGGTATAAVMTALAIVAPTPCPTETEYYCVRVRQSEVDRSARLLRLDRLTQGYSDLDDPQRLGFRFQRVIAAGIATINSGRRVDVMHIGGGAFAMPRYLDATRPGSNSRVLEIDPRLDDIAVDQLGLRHGTADVRNGDGRVLIRDEADASYDVVINDVLGSLDPPWHLTTVEAASEARRVLRDDGVYVVNAVDARELRFARSVAATLRAAFEYVVAVVPPAGHDEVPSNTVLFASDAPLSPEIPPEDGRVLDRAEFDGFVRSSPVLRDDFAPVERLVSNER